jgi:hypothetical protein
MKIKNLIESNAACTSDNRAELVKSYSKMCKL